MGEKHHGRETWKRSMGEKHGREAWERSMEMLSYKFAQLFWHSLATLSAHAHSI